MSVKPTAHHRGVFSTHRAMNQAQRAVERFMLAIPGQRIRKTPGFPSRKIAALRVKLIREEAIRELCDAIDAGCDLRAVADGIGDSLYVILGTASAFGLDAEGIFNEIHRSNMTKLRDGKIGKDGKLIKGPLYEPPNLDPFIK